MFYFLKSNSLNSARYVAENNAGIWKFSTFTCSCDNLDVYISGKLSFGLINESRRK